MSKSFHNKELYGEYEDYEMEEYSSQKLDKQKDKKLEIQRARKQAQAERDRAIAELNVDDD